MSWKTQMNFWESEWTSLWTGKVKDLINLYGISREEAEERAYGEVHSDREQWCRDQRVRERTIKEGVFL